MTSKSRRNRWILFFIVATCAIAAWPSYRWWVRNKIASLDAACDRAREQKDWVELEERSREWLTWDETSGDAWLNLATAAQEQDDIELALECLERIPNDHEKVVPALLLRMDLLMQQDLAFDAEETAQRIIKIQSRAGKAHTFLIYFAAMTLRREEMLRRIRRAIDLQCEPPDAYAYLVTAPALRFSNGYHLNNRWLQKYPKNETLLVARAIYLATTSDSPGLFEPNPSLGGDEREIRTMLKRYPRNHEVVGHFLLHHMAGGNIKEVGNLLRNAPQSGENDSRFWRARGWYFLQQEQLAKAEDALRKAVQKNRYDWRSWHLLSTVLRRRMKIGAAKEAAEFSDAGKRLEREVLTLPKASSIERPTLLRIADFARQSLDWQVHHALRRRTGQ